MRPGPFIFFLLTALVLVSFRAGAAELSPKEEKQARTLYENKCAKCHKFYEPKGYPQAEWDEWMAKMAKKSKLRGAQNELLTRYLNEYRAGRIANLPGDKK